MSRSFPFRSSIRTIDCVQITQPAIGLLSFDFQVVARTTRASKSHEAGRQSKSSSATCRETCYVYSTLFLANKRKRERRNEKEMKEETRKLLLEKFDGSMVLSIFIIIVGNQKKDLICSFETLFTSTIDAEAFLFSFTEIGQTIYCNGFLLIFCL